MTDKKCPKCGSELVVESVTFAYNMRVKILRCPNKLCNYETFLRGIENKPKRTEKPTEFASKEKEFHKGVKNRRKEQNIF